ncbi:hypothetical protein GOP47_0023987 [Adiantum capillus-veneris]|uniref:Uncharacterized protein n=1 Tax=Adiantum capillus-veneris TaxID=13818 RepID=A0A9D4U5N9_ADICA|nr:hypothetical protein GOP47_0023987 [Adiantum capillus-veneris]
MTKLTHGHQRSSSGTGPLFPPLHVNDTGKASLKAPPRNKMALFEQFTVPFNCYLPPNKGAGSESASKQRGTNDFHNSYTQYSMATNLAPEAVFNSGVRGIGKSSNGSSLCSLSICSAIVNVDEQLQEPENDTYFLSERKLGMMSQKGWSPNEKVLKDNPRDGIVANGVFMSPHVDQNGQVCEQAVGSVRDSFQTCNKGSIAVGNLGSVKLDIKELSYQEIDNSNKGSASAPGGPIFYSKTTDCRPTENNTVSKASNQLKTNDKCALESVVNAFEKPAVVSQGDVASIAATSPTTHCDMMKSSPVLPLPANIKPKHVIHTIGQQLFWKARRAILRQQEVFANQVFELHKLIEVQKLLAKMPSTLIESHLISGMDLDMVVGDLDPPEVNSEKQEISNKVPAPCRCEGQQAHESRPLQRALHLQEREGQVVGVESQTKRRSHSSHWAQPMTNTPVGRAPHSSSSDGVSAWGYPMGSLNRPFLYLPGVSRIPSGASLGGPYVVGSNPLAPYTFPCYAPRPEQPAPIFCQSNQWPTPMYHNPVFTPMANDWFAMNYPNQVPLASGSEKPGPTNSVPSINMKAEASSQSVQPVVVPLSRRQQVAASSCAKLVAAKSLGSFGTASVSAPRDSLSGKPPGSGYVREHNPAPNHSGGSRVMPKGYGGESRLAIEVRGSWRDTKEGVQVPCCIREERMDMDRLLCEKNALNLFPLQPTNSSAGASEGQVLRRDEGSHGRIIKAIPRSALAASESAAGILRSLQRERQL